MHYFGVPSFRKKFFHEHIQSNLLDPKRCLGVFRNISQTFDIKIHAKVVFRGWKHYLGVPSFWKKFCHEHIQSNLLDPKWCLWVFWRISQIFDTRIHTKVLPRTNLIKSIRSKMMFGSISEDFANLRHDNSCKSSFSRLNTLFQVLNFRKKFCHERIQSNILDRKRCLGVFRSISQIFGKENHAKLVF